MSDDFAKPKIMPRARVFRLTLPRDLSTMAKRIAEIVFGYADDDGTKIFVGVENIAREAGEPARTVNRALAELAERKFLLDDGWRWVSATARTRQRKLDIAKMQAERAEQDARIGTEGSVPDLVGQCATPGKHCATDGTLPPQGHYASSGIQPLSRKRNLREKTLECTNARAREDNEPSDEQIAQEFEGWYREYPKKKDPDLALRAYRKARKAGASAARLLMALRDYRWNRDPQFIKFPASWLNAGAWKEKPSEEPVRQSQPDMWAQAAANEVAHSRGEDLPHPKRTPEFAGTTIDGEVTNGK